MEELTIIQIYADGQRKPHIPFGTSILLIQDGAVSVGKLMCDTEEFISVYIDHPKNQKELDPKAMKIVREQRPEYLKSQISLIVICPEDIADTMIW